MSPVMFTRRNGMAPLPVPVPGSLSDLKNYINVEDKDLPLVVGWILMAARGRGPYPVLIFNGEQGTGKSTTPRVVRSMADPSTVPLRGLTRDVRDILVSASNNHVVVADNLCPALRRNFRTCSVGLRLVEEWPNASSTQIRKKCS